MPAGSCVENLKRTHEKRREERPAIREINGREIHAMILDERGRWRTSKSVHGSGPRRPDSDALVVLGLGSIIKNWARGDVVVACCTPYPFFGRQNVQKVSGLSNISRG